MIDIGKIWPGWEIEELIGQGAYGRVYRVRREEMGERYYAALKVIEIPQDEAEISSLMSMGMDNLSIRDYYEQTAKSITAEIRMMESLKSAPNVVYVEEHYLKEHEGTPGWTILIRMELLESLRSYQLRTGAPDVAETVRIGKDICAAIECCESRKIIHRDIKPENIFHSDFGLYKLGDFGIARQIENATRSTFSQKGTGAYMAPEVSRGEKYDTTVDIYSLGLMLYQFLNRQRMPFLPVDSKRIMPNMMQDALERRLSGEALPAPVDAPPALARVILKACDPDPSRRYRHAADFREALLAFESGKLTDEGEGAFARDLFEKETPGTEEEAGHPLHWALGESGESGDASSDSSGESGDASSDSSAAAPAASREPSESEPENRLGKHSEAAGGRKTGLIAAGCIGAAALLAAVMIPAMTSSKKPAEETGAAKASAVESVAAASDAAEAGAAETEAAATGAASGARESAAAGKSQEMAGAAEEFYDPSVRFTEGITKRQFRIAAEYDQKNEEARIGFGIDLAVRELAELGIQVDVEKIDGGEYEMDARNVMMAYYSAGELDATEDAVLARSVPEAGEAMEAMGAESILMSLAGTHRSDLPDCYIGNGGNIYTAAERDAELIAELGCTNVVLAGTVSNSERLQIMQQMLAERDISAQIWISEQYFQMPEEVFDALNGAYELRQMDGIYIGSGQVMTDEGSDGDGNFVKLLEKNYPDIVVAGDQDSYYYRYYNPLSRYHYHCRAEWNPEGENPAAKNLYREWTRAHAPEGGDFLPMSPETAYAYEAVYELVLAAQHAGFTDDQNPGFTDWKEAFAGLETDGVLGKTVWTKDGPQRAFITVYSDGEKWIAE